MTILPSGISVPTRTRTMTRLPVSGSAFFQVLGVLFVEILLVGEALGLVKLGTSSLDGTKIKANASKHRALSW